MYRSIKNLEISLKLPQTSHTTDSVARQLVPIIIEPTETRQSIDPAWPSE